MEEDHRKMKHVLILVEGQTEEQYIKNVLSPYLNQYDIILTPTIINTKIVKGGNNFKGGLNRYQQVKNDLNKLFRDKSVFITTFFDFYRLPRDFPGYSKINNSLTSIEKVKYLENEFFMDLDEKRFIPFIQIHEFETLLFASIKGFNSFYSSRVAHLKQIQSIIEKFPNPEDINDNPNTAPSKRLISIFPEYNKPVQGVLIAIENGITETLNKCPHFADWVSTLLAI